jgi:hypothetical protein
MLRYPPITVPVGVVRGADRHGVLLHLPKDTCQSALEEVGRVLIPSGRALVSMKAGSGEGWRTLPAFPHRRWYAYYRPDEFQRLCRRAALTASAISFIARADWFSTVVGRTNSSRAPHREPGGRSAVAKPKP